MTFEATIEYGFTLKRVRDMIITYSQLIYYAVPSLADETPNRILIHVECNDISSKTSTPEKIANDILKMAKICRGYGVNDVFISSIICISSIYLCF